LAAVQARVASFACVVGQPYTTLIFAHCPVGL